MEYVPGSGILLQDQITTVTQTPDCGCSYAIDYRPHQDGTRIYPTWVPDEYLTGDVFGIDTDDSSLDVDADYNVKAVLTQDDCYGSTFSAVSRWFNIDPGCYLTSLEWVNPLDQFMVFTIGQDTTNIELP